MPSIVTSQILKRSISPLNFSTSNKPRFPLQTRFTTYQPLHHTIFAQRRHGIMADEALIDVEDKMQNRPPRSRGDRGRGKGSGGGGQGREVQVSKALSKLLRHQAANAGIQLDDEGYAPLDAVVSSASWENQINLKYSSWGQALLKLLCSSHGAPCDL
jgi:hypothetical protein